MARVGVRVTAAWSVDVGSTRLVHLVAIMRCEFVSTCIHMGIAVCIRCLRLQNKLCTYVI